MAVEFIRQRVVWLQHGEASIILMDPHQVDSHVIGNYDNHSACIVVLIVLNLSMHQSTSAFLSDCVIK